MKESKSEKKLEFDLFDKNSKFEKKFKFEKKLKYEKKLEFDFCQKMTKL